jgi:hypothetical protein
MKRVFVFAVGLVFLASCSQKPKEDQTKSNIFIEQKLLDFIKLHPTWTSGEENNAETTDKFQHEVKRWSNEEAFLDNMPFQLNSVKDTTLNGQTFKMGTFIGYNDNLRPKGSILNYVQLRIDGFLPPEVEKTLKVSGKYTIKGMLFKQGSRNDVKVIHVAEFKGYDLGKYLFSISQAKAIE